MAKAHLHPVPVEGKREAAVVRAVMGHFLCHSDGSSFLEAVPVFAKAVLAEPLTA